MTHRFELDLDGLQRITRELQSLSGDLKATHVTLGALVAQVDTAGAAAGDALEYVQRAQAAVGDTAEHLDRLHIDVRRRTALMTRTDGAGAPSLESSSPSGAPGTFFGVSEIVDFVLGVTVVKALEAARDARIAQLRADWGG